MRAGGTSRTKLLLSLLLAVAIFAFLLRRVDVAGVKAEIQEMTWVELVTIALLAVAVGGFWLMLRSERAAARVGELAERAANRARRLLRRPPVHGWATATDPAPRGDRRRRGRPGPGAVRGRLRPAGHGHPVHLGRCRGGRGGAHRRAGRFGRRSGPGDRLGARLPGLTWLLPVPLGLVTYLGWRWRHHRRTAGGPVARVR